MILGCRTRIRYLRLTPPGSCPCYTFGQMALPLANDTDRLNALVEAMAEYLKQGMILRDPGMDNGGLHLVHQATEESLRSTRAPVLARTLYEEARYLPNREQLDYLEDLKESYGCALQADKLARALLSACQVPESLFLEPDSDLDDAGHAGRFDAWVVQSDAVAISSFASEWGYYNYRILPEYGGMVIGGVGRLLRRSVRDLAVEWLLACDRTLCHVHDEEQTPPPAGLTALVDSLSKDIAKRVTLHHKPIDVVPMEVDHLDPRYFEARADVEFARTRVDERCRKRNDLLSLNALAIVARDGGSSVEATEV